MKRFLLILAVLAGNAAGKAAEGLLPKNLRLEEFAVSSDAMILEGRHLYNFSGSISIQPDTKQIGFGNCFSPPFVGNPICGTWMLQGHPIPAETYIWYPAATVLKGRTADGLDISGQVVPLSRKRAFAFLLSLENKAGRPIQAILSFELSGQIGFSRDWGWVPPAGRPDTTLSVSDSTLILSAAEAELSAVFRPAPSRFADNRPVFPLEIAPGGSCQITAVFVLGQPNTTRQSACSLLDQIEKEIEQAYQTWSEKVSTLRSRLPVLITDNQALQKFYQRCLLTFLTTRWELEDFILNPWYAESGLDGGAVCNYLWGDAYLSKFFATADPQALRALLLASLKADYSQHYALHPLTGEGIGVGYSYNYYSMALLMHDYIALTGDASILQETIRGRPLLDVFLEYVFEKEDLTQPPVLIDYGTNENLLELRRTQAYQHYTPSPNFERILNYQIMKQIYRWAGKESPIDFSVRTQQLQSVILDTLWDKTDQWFVSLDSNRKPQTCYSIQIFDLLRADLVRGRQAEAIVQRLNENEFLSQWGVHSLSKMDKGYDPTDIDWGGPGVYAGDAPELAADLLSAGFTRKGIDVLQRILWWNAFPYIPQAVRADSRDYRRDGRANVIAALAGAQTVVWGLFGIRMEGDTLSICPVRHPYTAGMGIENLRIRGRVFRIQIDPDGKHYWVQTDGEREHLPIGRTYRFSFPTLCGGLPEPCQGSDERPL
ncbi:MAG TPA: hypothetical protein PK054_00945 [Anaerohalosphaeraceae bacterium]|nr:hypothetical protein [Anaerohalosphaeraceae bacterium]HOL87778.1 hypothetical protein [Anaerohalosphaeraceae bacterium]HPP55130.1 hypothetical protein [Anaerohalosphaeraceae bacterium]